MFDIEKNSSIIRTFGKHIIPGAFKAVRGVVRAVGGGLLPTPKTAPIGQKVFGIATKAGAVGGLYSTTKKVTQNMARESEPTYTTLLRNNLLAGNIRPYELSTPDIAAIQKQGLR